MQRSVDSEGSGRSARASERSKDEQTTGRYIQGNWRILPREGGVLVAVFGILDHVVYEGAITSSQVCGAFGLAVVLLITGLIFERATEPRNE